MKITNPWSNSKSDTDNLLDPLKDGKNPLSDLGSSAKKPDTKISNWDNPHNKGGFGWG